MKEEGSIITFLKQRAEEVRHKTLRIHGIAPGTRLASSLSPLEIFVVLYYGRVLRFDPSNPLWSERDRFIVSKGHGAISLYPVLAGLGFFPEEELNRVCTNGALLGSIPDAIPGIETINGSLGHGLGVGCGMALALKRRGMDCGVFVLCGDGELYEGSVWEAVMLAAQHGLDNLALIVDNNRISMLDYCERIIELEPMEEKFRAFGWASWRVNGHDMDALYRVMKEVKHTQDGRPKVVVADTVKGRGVPQLEGDPLCHIKSLRKDEVEELLRRS